MPLRDESAESVADSLEMQELSIQGTPTPQTRVFVLNTLPGNSIQIFGSKGLAREVSGIKGGILHDASPPKVVYIQHSKIVGMMSASTRTQSGFE